MLALSALAGRRREQLTCGFVDLGSSRSHHGNLNLARLNKPRPQTWFGELKADLPAAAAAAAGIVSVNGPRVAAGARRPATGVADSLGSETSGGCLFPSPRITMEGRFRRKATLYINPCLWSIVWFSRSVSAVRGLIQSMYQGSAHATILSSIRCSPGFSLRIAAIWAPHRSSASRRSERNSCR